MKKWFLSVFLALTLCVGLAVPAFAADASGLDANSAKAYYDVLSSYQDSCRVMFADIKDMDADGLPELIVFAIPPKYKLAAEAYTATVDIWQFKNGALVKGTTAEFDSPGWLEVMEYVSKDGKYYLKITTSHPRTASWFRHHYIGVNGFYECVRRPFEDGEEYTLLQSGKATVVTEAQVSGYIADYTYNSHIMDGSDGIWWTESTIHHTSYENLLVQLEQKLNVTSDPAVGTFGPYTIFSPGGYEPFKISFSSAKVEKKAIQIRQYFSAPQEYTQYETREAIFVTVKPDAMITIEGGHTHGSFGGNFVYFGIVYGEGDNKYRNAVGGVANDFESGIARDVLMPNVFHDVGEYLITIDNSTGNSVSFTDVPAGQWYADAVNWAVSKNITNGTGGGKFSPGKECTHEQILTFLYRAARGEGKADPADMDKAVEWAREKGMIDSGFDGKALCTRADAVTYIWQALGKKDAKASSFADVPAGADCAKAVDWAVANGVTEGTGNGNFSPDKVCNRGTIVTFLLRAYVPDT